MVPISRDLCNLPRGSQWTPQPSPTTSCPSVRASGIWEAKNEGSLLSQKSSPCLQVRWHHSQCWASGQQVGFFDFFFLWESRLRVLLPKSFFSFRVEAVSIHLSWVVFIRLRNTTRAQESQGSSVSMAQPPGLSQRPRSPWHQAREAKACTLGTRPLSFILGDRRGILCTPRVSHIHQTPHGA